MPDLPLQLEVLNSGESETVTCERILREVPGTRVVYEGLRNGRPVIVKVFRNGLKGPMHLQKEWKTLQTLRDRNIDAPEPLLQGRTPEGESVFVQAKIVDSTPAQAVFDSETDPARRTELLMRLGRMLAEHHEKGVLQTDLHLGNFLLAGNRIVAIDPGRIRSLSGPIPQTESLDNLALLACSLFLIGMDEFERLLETYCTAREWEISPDLLASFRERVETQRQGQIRRALRKCMRSNRRHKRLRGSDWKGMFDRAFIEGADATELVKSMDRLMKSGEILKSGNTCYVSRLTWNGREIVIKRFNHKNPLHSLRQTLKRSRARRAWLNGHRLGMLGIATPKPLAYIEHYAWGTLHNCYLITEYLDGRNLYLYLTDNRVSDEDKSRTTDRIRRMIDLLTKNRITHGDMKYANVFVVGSEPYLMDLDSIIVHWLMFTQRIWMDADLKNFRRRGEELGCPLDL